MKELNFTPFPALETDRLILRQLEDGDAYFIYQLRTSPQNNIYLDLPIPADTTETLSYIYRMNQGIKDNKYIYWAITRKVDGVMVGTICLWNFDIAKCLAEVGYELLHSYQRQGYMREAFKEVVQYAIEQLGLITLEAYTHSANQPSIRLLEHYNFLQVRTLIETNSSGKTMEQAIYRKQYKD